MRAAAELRVHVRRAECPAEDPLGQVALLVRGLPADDRGGPLAGLPEPGRRRLERLLPACGAKLAALADEGLRDPLPGLRHLVAEPPLVAQPAVVDLGVVAGEDALDALVAHRQDHVALARAERADRAGVLDFPGTGPEPVGVRGQRPHRAELDDVAVEGGDVGAVVEGAHEGRRAAVQELELLVLGDLLAEADAAVAEDAALAVDLDQRRERDRLLEVALGVDHAASARAPAHRDVLKRALPALVADRAVEGVVDEQELDHRFLGGLDPVGAGVDDHPVADRRRAGGLKLRDPLDLHQAHPAGADRVAELRLVAEHRDLDVAVLGGVDQHRPFLRRHLDPVDEELNLGALRPHQAAGWASDAVAVIACKPAAPWRPTRRVACDSGDRFLELVAELRHHAPHRHRHRVAEHAQAVADDVLLHRGDDVEVHRGRLARDHPLEHLHRPVGALAAGGALPARLVVVEARRAQGQLGDRDRVVGDDDRPRAEHRARLGHRLEAVGEVELGRGQDRRRGAAREPRLDLAPVGRAAGEPVDQLPGGDPELDLVVAGPLDAARDRDDLGAGRLLGAEPLEPLGAVGDDVGHVGQGLDVVDQGRPSVEALDRRERRLEARVAALSLERVEQRRLLAADVGAGAAVDDHLDPGPLPRMFSPR